MRWTEKHYVAWENAGVDATVFHHGEFGEDSLLLEGLGVQDQLCPAQCDPRTVLSLSGPPFSHLLIYVDSVVGVWRGLNGNVTHRITFSVMLTALV